MKEERDIRRWTGDRVPGTALDRREFLRLAGASIALAGLDGCNRMPAENILPYVDNRPELTQASANAMPRR